MSISEAHRKLGHILCSAIKHAVANGLITGIDLDISSKPKFCKACAKVKSAYQPFPKSPTPGLRNSENKYIEICGV
jgi:hypothetical protein